MLFYHLYPLYRCLKFPEKTTIGYENHCRKAWVEKTVQIEAKDRDFALGVINGTISASTFLASTSLALSSLIGAWMGTSSLNIFFPSVLIGMPNADIPVRYKKNAVIRGSIFWSVGLRAIYFATSLLMWIFGPIPMVAASATMVIVLHILD
ncbi:uncharacterized protein LOC123212388 [Mangifera indica]|uniref:uncharacterized protein LOC123212388 n=1 Tax=Mangifera indica TaxID=29780 RepID=UPI001CFC0955|nr:uncharacterized protein LOC123212388 [Mangifera indica]